MNVVKRRNRRTLFIGEKKSLKVKNGSILEGCWGREVLARHAWGREPTRKKAVWTFGFSLLALCPTYLIHLQS